MKSVAALTFVTLILPFSSAGAVSCTDGKEELAQQLSPLIKDKTGAYLHTPADKFDDKFTIDYSDFYSDNAQGSENVRECTAAITVEEVSGGASAKENVHYRMITTEDGKILVEIYNDISFPFLAQQMMTAQLKKALNVPNGKPLTYDSMPPEMLAPQGPGSTADMVRQNNEKLHQDAEKRRQSNEELYDKRMRAFTSRGRVGIVPQQPEDPTAQGRY